MASFRLRDFTPKGLYARLTTLVAVPVIAIFAITTLYYYQYHIREVNEKLSQSIAREVALISDMCARTTLSETAIAELEDKLGLSIDCAYARDLAWPEDARPRFSYASILRQQLDNVTEREIDFRTIEQGSILDFRAVTGPSVARVLISRKRALAANTHFTIVWVLLGAMFMLGLAFAFLRNQVRSILELTEAAKAYGRGRNTADFHPSGATEIRDAVRAVADMRARLTSFADQRTSMLAGVSHDLRTPLTRLKLQLAMMEPSDEIDGARADLDEMSRMLDEYLAFASGEEGEQADQVRLDHMVGALLERFDRAHLVASSDITLTVRPLALNRTLSNLINNAIQYGERCDVQIKKGEHEAEILVDDDGPGIAPEDREAAFKPFHRLDKARTRCFAASRLGLAQAGDFAHAHGGTIGLEDSPLGGLRVRLKLPY